MAYHHGTSPIPERRVEWGLPFHDFHESAMPRMRQTQDAQARQSAVTSRRWPEVRWRRARRVQERVAVMHEAIKYGLLLLVGEAVVFTVIFSLASVI